MARPASLSGFPEFLPEGRIVEQRLLAELTTVFELHGFASVETRAIEPLEVLTGKGEIDKEIYAVARYQGEGADPDWALHYDLTVPFARYVLEHAGHLNFPFRRYQIQKVWRGERPQDGRFREFTQADVDIVGQDQLAEHHDAEIVAVAAEGFARLQADLGLPPARLRVNNRKLAEGFYRGLGVTDTGAVLQRIDKLAKIGPDRVATLLTDECGMDRAAAQACLDLATISTTDESFVERVTALGVSDPLLDEGLEQLATVLRTTAATGVVHADLSIARGLDYYTGTVMETELAGYEKLGSVASGGRYDQLASDGRKTYPGVGFSFGVSRMLVPLIGDGAITATRSVPTCVLVAVDSEDTRAEAVAVAGQLRARGIATEVAPKADKFGKQIRHADRRGIPYVWFSREDGDQVKDIRSGDQVAADPQTWLPPQEDLRPRVHPVT